MKYLSEIIDINHPNFTELKNWCKNIFWITWILGFIIGFAIDELIRSIWITWILGFIIGFAIEELIRSIL